MPLIVVTAFSQNADKTKEVITTYELGSSYPSFKKQGVSISAFLNRVFSSNHFTVSQPRKDYILPVDLVGGSFQIDVSALALEHSIPINYFLELWLNDFILEGKAYRIFPNEYKVDTSYEALRVQVQRDLQASQEVQLVVKSVEVLKRMGLEEVATYLEDGIRAFNEGSRSGDETAILNFRKVIDGFRQRAEKFSTGSDSRDEILNKFVSSLSGFLSNSGMHFKTEGGRDEAALARDTTLAITRYIVSKVEFLSAAGDAYVIDWSRPVGTFTADRVVVIGDQGYHMGGGIDEWARSEKLLILPGSGNQKDYLREKGIKEIGPRPLSELRLKRKTLYGR